MRRTVKAWLMAGAVCLAMVAVACGAGGDGDGVIGGGGDDAVSAEGKPYAESLEKNLTEGDEGKLELSDEQAGCIAPKWVNTMKPDRLKKAGIKPADVAEDDNAEIFVRLKLSTDEGNALVDAFIDCGVELKETYLASSAGLSDDDKMCLNDAISEDFLREILVLGFTEGPAALDEDSDVRKELEKVLDKCPGAGD